MGTRFNVCARYKQAIDPRMSAFDPQFVVVSPSSQKRREVMSSSRGEHHAIQLLLQTITII